VSILSAILMVATLFTTGVTRAGRVPIREQVSVSKAVVAAKIATLNQLEKINAELASTNEMLSSEEVEKIAQCISNPKWACIDYLQDLVAQELPGSEKAEILNAYVEVYQTLVLLYVATLGITPEGVLTTPSEYLTNFYEVTVMFVEAVKHLDDLIGL
jgi:hypothetical protein